MAPHPKASSTRLPPRGHFLGPASAFLVCNGLSLWFTGLVIMLFAGFVPHPGILATASHKFVDSGVLSIIFGVLLSLDALPLTERQVSFVCVAAASSWVPAVLRIVNSWWAVPGISIFEAHEFGVYAWKEAIITVGHAVPGLIMIRAMYILASAAFRRYKDWV